VGKGKGLVVWGSGVGSPAPNTLALSLAAPKGLGRPIWKGGGRRAKPFKPCGPFLT